MKLEDSLTSVPRIGPSTYLKLEHVNIKTVLDLLQLYPIRHENFQLKSQIAFLQPGETVTIKAKVIKSKNEFTRKRGLTLQKLTVTDLSDSIDLVWFNQPFVLRQFKQNEEYLFSGKVDRFGTKTVLYVEGYEIASDTPLHTSRLVPYYTSTLGLSSKVLRQRIFWLLTQIKKQDHPDYDTLFNLHFPKNETALEKAKQQLSFAYLLDIKLKQIRQEKLRLRKKNIYIIKADKSLKQSFIKTLPFQLTKSQSRVLDDLDKDFSLKTNKPRLLMGEVGSGKTVVMAYAAYLMSQNNFQTVVMTPTEALAQQHYNSFKQLFLTHNLNIALLTAKSKPSKLNKANIIIGTHALLFSKASWHNLGLLIVDEQHKFGVVQRELLFTKTTSQPRMLLVSATPIPRSLALTLYHHTNLSYLTDKPFVNQVKTFLVPEAKRESSYLWLHKLIKSHHQQAYLVCSTIENKQGQPNELKTVKQEAEKLSAALPDLKIEAIYSRHPKKQAILEAFRKRKIDILITTSLIEVGIDIGSANVIIIEDADRFGLNQLHQLRGRVGRRGQKGYCLLFSSSKDQEAINRLKILETETDAAKISLADLKTRGAGDLLGLAQHGFNHIRTVDLFNTQLMSKVNNLAEKMVAKNGSREYTSILVRNNI